MLGCDISVVKSVDGITPILLDFTPLGSVILSILSCLLTVIIGSSQGKMLVLQLTMEPLMEADQELNPNAVRIFLKQSSVIRERRMTQTFLLSLLNSPSCWIFKIMRHIILN